MTYQRARLWLGITTVGSVVTASAAALALDAPSLLPAAEEPWFGWAKFLLAAVVFLAPFDLLGGFVLPRRFGRSAPTLAGFLAAWSRGVAVQTAILFVAGVAVMAAASRGGYPAAIATAALGMLALLAFQGFVARLVSSFISVDGNRSVWASRDDGFTGGVRPFAGGPVIPARWVSALPSGDLKLLADRRAALAGRGDSSRGALAALAWNLTCFSVVLLLARPDLASAVGLATQALGFNLAGFVGLLLLPSVSRRAVLSADGALVRQGTQPAELASAIQSLDSLDEQETTRSEELESVFHPIPCASRRIERLQSGEPAGARGFWHVARYALYSSWACLGLLGRAVHCNCGRPALWVFLPAD